jgi:hypothetical protein
MIILPLFCVYKFRLLYHNQPLKINGAPLKNTANPLKIDPSPKGPLDRFLIRSKCFSNQQPAVSGQSERTWRDLGTLLTDKGRAIGRARFSFSASASSLRFDFPSLKSSGNRIDALTDHQQQFPRLLTQCFDRTSRQQT